MYLAQFADASNPNMQHAENWQIFDCLYVEIRAQHAILQENMQENIGSNHPI